MRTFKVQPKILEFFDHYFSCVYSDSSNVSLNVSSRHESYACQYVRVVKEADSKSAGETRTGSNPVADVF